MEEGAGTQPAEWFPQGKAQVWLPCLAFPRHASMLSDPEYVILHTIMRPNGCLRSSQGIVQHHVSLGAVSKLR